MARAQIIATRYYGTFMQMIAAEGYKNVIPYAPSAAVAANEYNKYYSAEDQQTYGVLAIEVKML